mmetsp:Transcript_47476/g.76178  ORF Transcript_47476/g.76178 Transcript_47476/m.76178 type:complete len:138 (+) Transcript_47476:1398-1811(+)
MQSSGLVILFVLLMVSSFMMLINGEDNLSNNHLQEKIKRSIESMNTKQSAGKARWNGVPPPHKKGIPGASFANPKLNDRQRFENLMKLKNEHGGKRARFNPASQESRFKQFQDKMKNLFKGPNSKEWTEKLKQKQDL